MKNVVLSATILFTAAQAHAGPFDGTYLPESERDSGATCQSLSGIFDGKTPYRIEEGWIEYMESGCKLSKPKAFSDGSVRYQASCATEGTEFREKLTISPADGGVVLKGDGWQEYWQSCSGQEQASSRPKNNRPNVQSATTSELIHGRCYLMTNGVVYLDGPCPIILDPDGGFQIGYEPGSDETGYWAFLHAPEGDTAEGNWNAAWGMTHAQASLGLLRRSGACWENSISQMCAWRE